MSHAVPPETRHCIRMHVGSFESSMITCEEVKSLKELADYLARYGHPVPYVSVDESPLGPDDRNGWQKNCIVCVGQSPPSADWKPVGFCNFNLDQLPKS